MRCPCGTPRQVWPRADSNRRWGKTLRRGLDRLSPSPSEHATPRTFRGRVAVPALTSGQQPEVVMDCGTAGSRTPRRGEKITKRPLEPFVPCPRALSQRGAGLQIDIITIMNSRCGERWNRTTEGRNESQSKVTANTTGARHSRAASSRRDAGFINQNMKNTFMVCGHAVCRTKRIPICKQSTESRVARRDRDCQLILDNLVRLRVYSSESVVPDLFVNLRYIAEVIHYSYEAFHHVSIRGI